MILHFPLHVHSIIVCQIREILNHSEVRINSSGQLRVLHVQCYSRGCAHELHKLTVATVFRRAYVPHTCPRIPCSLRDDSPVVRKNTLVVLTHLILNDMIKVKGQISAMALCLEDPEQKIADLAKLFFHELSKKVSMHTPVHINALHVSL